MNILLIYYTGTYNTRYLSCRAEEALAARGHTVTRVEIRRGTPVADTQGFDLIGFGYPIYGFNSPLPFNRYVKKLNIARGQKFFIYKNSGETFAVNNASSRILLRRMRKKGAIFAGEYHFVMPYNIHFAYDRPFVREILEKDEKLMRIMIHRLETGSAPKIQSNFWYNVASAAVSVQKIGGAVNSFFYRADMHKCVQYTCRNRKNPFRAPLRHVHALFFLLPDGCHKNRFFTGLESQRRLPLGRDRKRSPARKAVYR